MNWKMLAIRALPIALTVACLTVASIGAVLCNLRF
jgi:hypothetical protein